MRLRALVIAAGCAVALAAFQGAVGRSAMAQTVVPGATETPKLELSVEQRQLIYASISSRTHKSTAAPANFLPAVGATVPDAVETLPIPDTALEVVPKLRGYVCAFVTNQVLIVDAQSRKVIDLIGSGNEQRKTPAPS